MTQIAQMNSSTDFADYIIFNLCKAIELLLRDADKPRHDDSDLEDLQTISEPAVKLHTVYKNRGHATLLFFSAGRDRAFNDFNKAVELAPGDAEARFLRGRANERLRNFDAALQDYSRAIELDPVNAGFHYWRGVFYRFHIKNTTTALRDYDRAIELDPAHAEALLGRGCLYGKLKNYAAAFKDFDRLVELDPTDFNTFCQRMKMNRKKGDLKAALHDLDTMIRLTNDSNIYNWRADIHARMGNFNAAIRDYTKYFKLTFNLLQMRQDDVHLRRGRAFMGKGDIVVALRDFNAAIKLNPKNAKAHTHRARAHTLLGNHDAAKKDTETAAALAAKEPGFSNPAETGK